MQRRAYDGKPAADIDLSLPVIDMKRPRWGHNVCDCKEAGAGLSLPADHAEPVEVVGCLTPLPELGQRIDFGAHGVWWFTHLEEMGNPRDGFFGRISRMVQQQVKTEGV